MRKWRLGVVTVVLATALVGISTASAVGHGGRRGWETAEAGSVSAASCAWTEGCWRDADGDGIRDTRVGLCADADGDGRCDACGWSLRSCADADGDGMCDHCETGHTGGGHHSGRGSCRW